MCWVTYPGKPGLTHLTHPSELLLSKGFTQLTQLSTPLSLWGNDSPLNSRQLGLSRYSTLGYLLSAQVIVRIQPSPAHLHRPGAKEVGP